jgi:hypothetical protein
LSSSKRSIKTQPRTHRVSVATRTATTRAQRRHLRRSAIAVRDNRTVASWHRYTRTTPHHARTHRIGHRVEQRERRCARVRRCGVDERYLRQQARHHHAPTISSTLWCTTQCKQHEAYTPHTHQAQQLERTSRLDSRHRHTCTRSRSSATSNNSCDHTSLRTHITHVRTSNG